MKGEKRRIHVPWGWEGDVDGRGFAVVGVVRLRSD
jgi:hypothetical protein